MTVVTDIYEFEEEWQNGHYTKKILIEGDSWVSHPLLLNISEQIEHFNSREYLILNIAEPGDEANSIFNARGKQMKRLKKLLKTTSEGDNFDLVFLSAAGNDIVGPEIIDKGYVRNKKDFPNLIGRELLTPNYYNMLGAVIRGYRRFLKLRDNSSMNNDTPVITHVYSYLTPREIGTHIGGILFNKGWIKRHLTHQNIKDRDEQYDIVVEMLDSFYRRLKQLEDKYINFMVVDTRKVLLKENTPDPELWYDEIHPNSKGFRKLARHIRKEAQKAGLWDL